MKKDLRKNKNTIIKIDGKKLFKDIADVKFQLGDVANISHLMEIQM